MPKLQFDAAITKDLKTAASDSYINNLRMIEIGKITPNSANFYELSELNELADDIERQGLMSALIVTEESGGYTLISGHRRLAAVKKLIDEGRLKAERVPCYIKGAKSKEETELDLIMLNSTQRKYSDAEKMMEYQELERIFKALEQAGKPVKGKSREKIGRVMNVSPAQVGKIKNISQNGISEVEKAVKDGKMTISTANEVAKLAPEQQKKIIEEKPDISHKEVKEIQKSSPKPSSKAPEVGKAPKSAPISAPKPSPLPPKKEPCTLTEQETKTLRKYIEQLFNAASEEDAEIIKGIADKLARAE